MEGTSVSDSVWKGARLHRWSSPGIIFGFQHEDARVEHQLAFDGCRALCIGSGGEVAFALLAAGAGEVVAVDVNPAQLILIRSKLFALETNRVEWLTKNASALAEQPALPEDLRVWWARNTRLLRRGLCFSGVVERRTLLLAPLLRWFARNPGGIWWKMGWSFLRVAIVAGYSWKFRRRLPAKWMDRLSSRIAGGVARNPCEPLWLAELGLGFGELGLAMHHPDHLNSVLKNRQRLFLFEKDLAGYLRECPDERWDLISLSNIVDTLDAHERTGLLDLVRDRLRRGGILLLRSIVLSQGDLPEIDGIEWLSLPDDAGWVCPIIGLGRRL